jgi:3-oxoacyl-[acyl-carrier protein] reductase
MADKALHGKVALVTGASRGIGREIALTLAREGARVGVNCLPDATQETLARAVVEEAERGGAAALVLPADVTDGRAVREAVARLVDAYGRLDVVVTNAGISHRARVVDLAEADWDRVLAVNLKGAFNAIQAALPYMERQRSGTIVTIASELALAGRAGSAHYCASKAGVIAFTKALAREVAPLGITANAVAPGPTDTDMLRANPKEFRDEVRDTIPLGRWGAPRDVALTVLFLASEGGTYYTGQVLSPNGGTVI